MTSVLTVQPSNIIPPLPATFSPTMAQVRAPTPPQNGKPEEEERRGRPRSRSDSKGGDSDAGGDGDNKNDNSSNEEGPARKRRRSRKGLDKKFECPTEGCGKSYSRAEHLYRHQLNHAPKQIYRCDFPDCNRTFVRLDLCNRHKDRHTAKGSALNRKDSLLSQTSPIDGVRPPYGSLDPLSPEANRPASAYNAIHSAHLHYQSPKDTNGSPYTPMGHTPPTGYPHSAPPTAGVMGNFMQPDYGGAVSHSTHPSVHASPVGPGRPTVQANNGSYGILSPVSTQHGSYVNHTSSTPQSATAVTFTNQQNFPAFTLPPSDFTASSNVTMPRDSTAQPYTNASNEYADQSQTQAPDEMMLLDQMASQQTIPVFGPDGLKNSPYISIPEDFVAYLFNTSAPDSSPSLVGHMMPPNQSYEFQNQYGVPYYPSDGGPPGYFSASNLSQQVMSVTNILDQNLPESVLTEEKSNEIFEFIKSRFHEEDDPPLERQRDKILDGDRSDDSHMLSRKMMQQYIGSYWLHFSDQVPILHKPTFSPEKTHNLLLMAMMSIGAACLDRSHEHKVTKAGAELSNFLAWHLRWELFMDANARPPAKLWVFQTLILLELYEKMYSTRELHERAHIHHATTITLMRRGRSLIGKTSLDSPPSSRDDKHGSSSRQSSTSGPAHTPDEWWNHWITNEITRRTAFAAFLLDSIHATMFGHSTVMVAHEMRLPLPCDDQLWKATSGAEVSRLESNMHSTNGRQISFLEGLKRTLGGHEVSTNPFGRQILMAGLLSVSWHMNQRDLQVSSLGGGMSQALGGRDKWRSTLTRAFDSWKTDFDKSLQQQSRNHPDINPQDPYSSHEKKRREGLVFESRVVLHHLAHMAMHVDIVDCQIFARAKRLLGRTIGPQDLSSAQRRMRDVWAPSAKARDATFYALRFLCSVLLDDGEENNGNGNIHHANGGNNHEGLKYFARDDVLLNRPWVLYFAALVVWCYGYALEGPCDSTPGSGPPQPENQMPQMRAYLRRLGSVPSPEDLKLMTGVNQNSALLMVLKDSFASTRWELLHEGATLLSNCIGLNHPNSSAGMGLS